MPRATRRYDRPVGDREFVARVRRHTPASFVPLVAELGAAHSDRSMWMKPMGITPWALAELARVSLVLGTDFNRSAATLSDVIDCVNAYKQLTDPDLHRQKPGAVGDFLMRTAAQQLVYQRQAYYDLARSVAIFERTKVVREEKLKVAAAGWDRELFGCSLGDYLNTAFVLHVGALRNVGMFDPTWIDQPQFEGITRLIGTDILSTMHAHFVADRALLAATERDTQERVGRPTLEYRQFGFNPLSQFPVVSGLGERWFIPVPDLVLRKASPLGLFYSGLERWGKAFADDIGPLFEAYIGDQLRELDATVLPEIKFGPAKQPELSVDWFVVFDECVLLIEAKSARPTEAIRWGGPNARQELERILAKGIKQLTKSAKRVIDGDPQFAAIPADRPVIGLVVTMEPFHVVNTPFVATTLPECSIPYRVCSAEEIEGLVGLLVPDGANLGALLLEHMTDPDRDGHSIKVLIENKEMRRNRILDEAWASFEWPNPEALPEHGPAT
jgi:hypothetical protein